MKSFWNSISYQASLLAPVSVCLSTHWYSFQKKLKAWKKCLCFFPTFPKLLQQWGVHSELRWSVQERKHCCSRSLDSCMSVLIFKKKRLQNSDIFAESGNVPKLVWSVPKKERKKEEEKISFLHTNYCQHEYAINVRVVRTVVLFCIYKSIAHNTIYLYACKYSTVQQSHWVTLLKRPKTILCIDAKGNNFARILLNFWTSFETKKIHPWILLTVFFGGERFQFNSHKHAPY